MDPSSWVGKDGTRRWANAWDRDPWGVPPYYPVPRIRYSGPGSSFDVVVVKPAITSEELDAIPDELIAELGKYGDDISREDIVYGTRPDYVSDVTVFYVTNTKTGQRYERISPNPIWFTQGQLEKAKRFYGADALWHFRFRK